jgi:hypothetical protein
VKGQDLARRQRFEGSPRVVRNEHDRPRASAAELEAVDPAVSCACSKLAGFIAGKPREIMPVRHQNSASSQGGSGCADAAESSSTVEMGGPRIRTAELRKLGPRFADASEGAQRLHPRRQAFLREGAARKTPLVLAERPQRLVGATGSELLLGFR